MLQLLRLTIIIAFVALTTSCDKEKQEDSQLLEGSTWKLRAYINAANGDVQFASVAHSVEITFLKEGKYLFSADSKKIQSYYQFRSETGCASFSKPPRPTAFNREVNAYLTTTLKSSNYELTGNNLKIVSQSTNRFLIFERIK
jgi:hypothetical protein